MTTLSQIQKRIANLKKQAETIAARTVQSALDDIRGLMERHGLTVSGSFSTSNVESFAIDGRM